MQTSHGTRPAEREVNALLTVALVVLLGFAGYRFFQLVFYPIYRGLIGAPDLTVFLQGAELYTSGQSLYPDPGRPTTYLYPPTLALALAPLVGSPYAVAIFRGVAAGALGLSIALLATFAARDRWKVAALLAIVAVAAWPVHLLIRQGQVDSITLVLMVAGLWLAWRGHPHWAALAIAAAISLKVTPGVLVLFFLWKRRYRLAAECLVFAVAIVLAEGLFVGLPDLVTYVTRVLPRIGSEGHAYWYNQSIHAIFLRLFTENKYTTPVANLGLGAVVLATNVTAALLLLATLWSMPRRWPRSASLYLVEAGAFVTLEVLSVSLSWQYHTVWMLVPLAGLLLVVLEQPTRPVWLPAAVGVALLGFIAGPYEPPFEYGRFIEGWASVLQSHTVAANLFTLGLTLYVAFRSRTVPATLAAREAPSPQPSPEPTLAPTP